MKATKDGRGPEHVALLDAGVLVAQAALAMGLEGEPVGEHLADRGDVRFEIGEAAEGGTSQLAPGGPGTA